MPGLDARVLDVQVLRRPERLAALERARLLLSSSAVPLDSVALLAAASVSTPIALITLVDADQMYVAGSHGAPPSASSARTAPISASFCQYVVSGDRPVAVDDSRANPAVSGHWAEQGHHLLAYLGHPVRDPTGQPVGAICVVDTVPRRWTEPNVASLGEAARVVEGMLATELTAHDLLLGAAATDAVLDATLEPFVTVSATGLIIRWNAAAEATFGWPAADLLGREASELIVPERFRSRYRDALTRISAGAGTDLFSERLPLAVLHHAGHEVPVEASLTAVAGPGAMRVHAFLRDRTERMAADREHTAQRRLVDALLNSLDHLDVGVAACDRAGHPILFNHPPEESITTASNVALSRAFGGEPLRELELSVNEPGRPPRVLLVDGGPIDDADGNRLGAVVATHDVTERRRAERFAECEVVVARVLSHATSAEDVGPAVLGSVGGILGWRHAELWLAHDIGSGLRPVATWTQHGHDLRSFVPATIEARQGLAGAAWHSSEPIWMNEGEGPELINPSAMAEHGLRLAVAIPVRSAERALGVLTFFADSPEERDDALLALLAGVAAHVGQFIERRRAEELAVELGRTKDEFIALVGHELRTPLTSVSAYTDLLLTDTELSSAERQEFLAIIHRNAEVLRAIIDDLLDLAGLESGYVTMRTAPVDFATIVHDSVAAARPAAEAKSVTITLRSDVSSAPLVGDADRLRQAIDHLITNAVTYTLEGGTVAVHLAYDGLAYEVTVADTGIGIPPAEREQLFQRFFRASNTRSRGIPGTGLGLSISRTIVERHAGAITLRDHAGPGTTFQVRLPAAR